MQANKGHLILVVAAVGAAGAIYVLKHNHNPTAQPDIQAAAETQLIRQPGRALSSQPAIKNPVPAESSLASEASRSPAQNAVPTNVDESDQSIQHALIGLFGKKPLEAMVHLSDFIRRAVVTADNSTLQRPAPSEVSVFISPAAAFRTLASGDGIVISPENSKRYAPYVELVKNVDAKKLVAVYVHFYKLFQAAYRDQTPNGYFNDKLIEVIDDMLAAPDIQGPIKLVADHAFYKYADPSLEATSIAQRCLMRIGSANAAIVKAKLRQIRVLLARS